jgi:hypothetical protein
VPARERRRKAHPPHRVVAGTARESISNQQVRRSPLSPPYDFLVSGNAPSPQLRRRRIDQAPLIAQPASRSRASECSPSTSTTAHCASSTACAIESEIAVTQPIIRPNPSRAVCSTPPPQLGRPSTSVAPPWHIFGWAASAQCSPFGVRKFIAHDSAHWSGT